MNLPLTFTFLILAATLHARPVEPMTGKDAVSQVSAIAGKFSDVYSQDPSKVSDFTIGSNTATFLASEGIERIAFICIDGFTKLYDLGETSKGKTKKITYKSADSGVVEFEDGASLHATWHSCSARPISFIIYRRITNSAVPLRLPKMSLP